MSVVPNFVLKKYETTFIRLIYLYLYVQTFVMDAKLTLKLNQEIIEKAKKYASDKKLSLSKLIENYLNSLTSDKNSNNEIEISPFVKSLATGSKIPADYDYKAEYSNHLLEKYK